MGRAILYSEANETELVSFKARDFAAYIPVGSVIAISDINLLGISLGGLVKTASTTTVTFETPIEIKVVSGFNEQFYLALYPDVREAIRNGVVPNGLAHYQQHGISEGRIPNGYLIYLVDSLFNIVVRRITNSPGNYTTLNFASISFIPPVS